MGLISRVSSRTYRGNFFLEMSDQSKAVACADQYSCEVGTPKFYALCAVGGAASCGITHTAVVPLDLVKCRIQVDPAKYGNLGQGFKVTLAEEGFKILYSGIIGEEQAYLNRMSLYLAASASAEFFADMFLAPFEAMKVRIQTMPGYANNMREAYAKMSKESGNPFYKGLKPLWLRQIPYTMMKFSCFEKTVEMLYAHVVPKPRAECTKGEQLMVTFAAGYIAGVFCAIVSHPADCVVSVLNKSPNLSAGQVVSDLGFKGLWAGLGPRILMVGTLTALQWFIYDSVKVALRLPRPPPPTMPESLRKRLEAEGKLE